MAANVKKKKVRILSRHESVPEESLTVQPPTDPSSWPHLPASSSKGSHQPNLTRQISFADILKQHTKLPPKEPTLSTAAAVASSSAVTKSTRPKLEQLRRPRVSGPNKISAATFAQIGRSGEAEKYVMGSENDASDVENRLRPRTLRQDIEVEFSENISDEDDDLQIEFSGKPWPETKAHVNKISAGTFQDIGRSGEQTKYVMEIKPTWSSIVGKGQKTGGPASEREPAQAQTVCAADPESVVRRKFKEKEELTPEERELLRKLRKERRQRAKENKRRDKEEVKRLQLTGAKDLKINLISRDVLQKFYGSGSKKTEKVSEKSRIKFQDEEYPDLGMVRKKQPPPTTEIGREARDASGALMSDAESGSDWETDVSERLDSDYPDIPDTGTDVVVFEYGSPGDASTSYSSILKRSKPAMTAGSQPPPEVKPENSSDVKPKLDDVKKKVTTKTPIEFDLMTALTVKVKGKKEKKSAPTLRATVVKKVPEPRVRNMLDSSAPTRKRGKEREGGKKKRKTVLKKAILAERARKREAAEQRRLDRIQQGVKLQPLQPPSDLEDGQHQPTVVVADVPPVVVDLKQSWTPSPQTEMERLAEKAKELQLCESADASKLEAEVHAVHVALKTKTDHTKAGRGARSQPKASARQSSSETAPELTVAPLMEDQIGVAEDHTEAPEDRVETLKDRAKKRLHSRKFREYCDHDLSKDLDTFVTNLMSDLIRFQDRQFAKDPVKAKAKRRYVVGLRETTKFLKVKKISSVIVAPDLEKISSEGGLDAVLSSILGYCREQGVNVVFSMNRHRLGRVCLRKVPVSCIGILNHQGSDENYKEMLALAGQLRESYDARLTSEIETLRQEEEKNWPNNSNSSNNSRNTIRPSSSLSYCPGKEFYPRGWRPEASAPPSEMVDSSYWYQPQQQPQYYGAWTELGHFNQPDAAFMWYPTDGTYGYSQELYQSPVEPGMYEEVSLSYHNQEDSSLRILNILKS